MIYKTKTGPSDKIKLYSIVAVSVCLFMIFKNSSYFPQIFKRLYQNNNIIGWVLSVFIIILALYSLRKKYLLMIIGKLTSWYSSHFYLGLICVFILILHSNFSFGFGLERIIILLLLYVFINSSYGIFIQLVIPEVLVSLDAKPGEYLEIESEKKQLVREINRLIENKSIIFKQIVKTRVKKLIKKNEGIISLIKQILSKKFDLSDKLHLLVSKKDKLPEHEKNDYYRLLGCYNEKYKQERQLFFIRLMNNWLNYHIFSVTALFVTMLVHIFSYSYY